MATNFKGTLRVPYFRKLPYSPKPHPYILISLKGCLPPCFALGQRRGANRIFDFGMGVNIGALIITFK